MQLRPSPAGSCPAAGSSSSSKRGPVGERARDLEPALLAVGQVDGALVGTRLEAELAEELERRGSCVRARLAMRRGCAAWRRPARRRRVRGSAARTLSRPSASANSRMFWNVRAMPGAAICVRACGPGWLRPSKRIAPAVGCVDAGDQVEDRGLAGAVRADQARRQLAGDLTARSSRATALRPPKLHRQPRASSNGRSLTRPPRGGAPARRPSSVAGRSRGAEQALRARDHQHDQQQRVDHHAVFVDAAQHFGQHREHDGRERSSP